MKLFDAIICLALDKREKEWRQLQADCIGRGYIFHPFIVGDGTRDLPYDYIDIDPPTDFVWGYGSNLKTKTRHWSALRSHKEIIRLAKKQGYRRILLVEDDIYWTSRADEVLSRVQIPDEFNLLYLGYWMTPPNETPEQFDSRIEAEWRENKECGVGRMERCGGLHAVVVDESMYNFILGLPETNPIDSQLNHIHAHTNNLYMYPKIIHVKSLYSSCEDMFVERPFI